MKRAIFLLIAVSLVCFSATAQTKPLETAKIKTPTVGCESCKTRIEEYLKRYDGITYVNVNWRKKETMVKYLTNRINLETIKAAIANVGYDADDVPANPEAYQKLPKTCKKPEDGGHKQ